MSRASASYVNHFARALARHQGLVDEFAQQWQYLFLWQNLSGGHRLGGFQGEAAREDCQPPQQAALWLRQQVVAPVDQRGQGLLARRCGAVPGVEQAEAVSQPLADLGQREASCARSGQFQGHGHAVELAADGHHVASVGRRQPLLRPNAEHPLGKQGHGRATGQPGLQFGPLSDFR